MGFKYFSIWAGLIETYWNKQSVYSKPHRNPGEMSQIKFLHTECQNSILNWMISYF